MQVHTYELQRYCRAADRIDTVSCQSQHRCGASTGRTVSVSSGSSGREPPKPTLNITAHIWSKDLSNTQLSRHYSHTTRRTGESNRTKTAIFAGWLRQRDVDYSAAHSVRYHITLAWHGMAGKYPRARFLTEAVTERATVLTLASARVSSSRRILCSSSLLSKVIVEIPAAWHRPWS